MLSISDNADCLTKRDRSISARPLSILTIYHYCYLTSNSTILE